MNLTGGPRSNTGQDQPLSPLSGLEAHIISSAENRMWKAQCLRDHLDTQQVLNLLLAMWETKFHNDIIRRHYKLALKRHFLWHSEDFEAYPNDPLLHIPRVIHVFLERTVSSNVFKYYHNGT